jgi:transketolase
MRQACLDMVHELAKADPRVLFVGSDLGAGVLQKMKDTSPDRFIMEGVSEQNLVGMAAGLAMSGYVPYVNTIATFLTRRCFEQIAVDVCLHNLPVRLIANGGGVVYAPLGPTHMAIEDIAIMRALPNMTVVAPADAREMARLMAASLDWPGPIYIRVAKGGDPAVSSEERGFAIGRAIAMREGAEVAILSTGVMTSRALKAAEMLAAEGIEAGVLHLHTVKPLDEEAVLAWAARAGLLLTVEEHVLTGGLGSAVLELLADRLARPPRVKRLGLPDRFTERYGSQDELLRHYGLQPEQIAAAARGALPRAAQRDAA